MCRTAGDAYFLDAVEMATDETRSGEESDRRLNTLWTQRGVQNNRYPVTAGGIARLRAHFRGRLKIEPNYSGDWVAPYCAGRASLNAERWDVEVIPGSLTRAMKRLMTTADVHVRLYRLTNRWLTEQRVPAGKHVHCVGGAADADTYQEALRNLCAGTVRFPFDRNPTVGGLMCQQQYHRLVVQERETSAAQFEKVTTGNDYVMEELKSEYRRLMMHTVATFDNHGSFGNLYIMVKDKCRQMRLYRPIQPNYTSPIATAQNRLGRAADFIVDAVGGYGNPFDSIVTTHILMICGSL
ncbi:hypothetical protein CYMTET_21881 [Cymbomonas tetramitiformis]|uniref:Uncharacterized protein n=1 Tax=Cymbomonas tetramitiformis TaxID=36881 RepID=A0AAE0L2S6_9CHLO|nr:hypothetical protein CYMTET_21881 [Cymbomonas tetramitiformis]